MPANLNLLPFRFCEQYARTTRRFLKLSSENRMRTVACSIIAFVLTLPLFGIGGFVAFYYLTHHYPTCVEDNLSMGEDDLRGIYLSVEGKEIKNAKKIPNSHDRSCNLNIEAALSDVGISWQSNQTLFIIAYYVDYSITYAENSSSKLQEALIKWDILAPSFELSKRSHYIELKVLKIHEIDSSDRRCSAC